MLAENAFVPCSPAVFRKYCPLAVPQTLGNPPPMTRRAIVVTCAVLAVCTVGAVVLKPDLASARPWLWRSNSLAETGGFTAVPNGRGDALLLPRPGDSVTVGPYCPIPSRGAAASDSASLASGQQAGDSLLSLVLEGQSLVPSKSDSTMCVGTNPPLNPP